MQDYLHQIKVITDQLAACGSPVGEDDIILQTLNGLLPAYRPFQTSIRTRSRMDLVSIEELHTLLICEELSMVEDSSPAISTTFTASKQQNPRSNNSQKGQNHGPPSQQASRGRRPPNFKNASHGHGVLGSGPSSPSPSPQSNRPVCQICHKIGHFAIDCYHRMDHAYQGRVAPQRLAAMVATHQPGDDDTWYSDTGANHITPDLGNLSIHSQYQGHDTVRVGNGQGLFISNIGSSSVHTPSTVFRLNKILHCPQASTNLLSIQQFARDNKCYFCFDDIGFSVKDKISGKTLFQGPLEHRLPVSFFVRFQFCQ